MPKKSVREMTAGELARYSLSGRLFRMIIIMIAIIGAAAMAFGYYLYDSAIEREFKSKSWNVSRTGAYIAINEGDIATVRRKVIDIYESADPTDEEKGSEEYLALFKGVKNQKYKELENSLHTIQLRNDAYCLYVGLIDKEKDRMIYLVDSDRTATHRDPGYYDNLEKGDYEAYVEGTPPSALDRALGMKENIPAILDRSEEYGHMCTAGTIIKEGDRYITVAFCDLDMNEVVAANQMFLVQYFVLLLVVTLLMAWLVTKRMRKTVAEPLNSLADAAVSYSNDRSLNLKNVDHFGKLNIHTGDEIENLSLIMQDMEAEIRENAMHLTLVTAEKERINTELDLARNIQEGMVPHSFPAFPEKKEFDIYASMAPAREVGGDFYDYFMIDDDHLAMTIADVSGKGIPASLLMMSSMILVETICKQKDVTPADILCKINDAICSNNPSEMFVTVWIGILELSTGKLSCANAGHEYPAIRRAGGKFELFKDPHGFVVGGMECQKYKNYELTLEPGDIVFEYTDGVTDAVNFDQELFGEERMMEALDSMPADAGPEEILKGITDAIDDYAEGTDPFDDLTMLCVRYNGKAKAVPADTEAEITLEAETENWTQVYEFLQKELVHAGVPVRESTQILVAAEEIFTNISRYAYAPGHGDATVSLKITHDPAKAEIEFADSGVAFNPLDRIDPDTTLSSEERPIGGLGLYIVKRTMDGMAYERKEDKNILTLTKNF